MNEAKSRWPLLPWESKFESNKWIGKKKQRLKRWTSSGQGFLRLSLARSLSLSLHYRVSPFAPYSSEGCQKSNQNPLPSSPLYLYTSNRPPYTTSSHHCCRDPTCQRHRRSAVPLPRLLPPGGPNSSARPYHHGPIYSDYLRFTWFKYVTLNKKTVLGPLLPSKTPSYERNYSFHSI